jgi:hypothetical protein
MKAETLGGNWKMSVMSQQRGCGRFTICHISCQKLWLCVPAQNIRIPLALWTIPAVNWCFSNRRLKRYLIKNVDYLCCVLSCGWFTSVCSLFKCQHFRTLSVHLHRQVGMKYGTSYLCRWYRQCSETLAFKLQTSVNHPEESIQHSKHDEILKSYRLFMFSKSKSMKYKKIKMLYVCLWLEWGKMLLWYFMKCRIPNHGLPNFHSLSCQLCVQSQVPTKTGFNAHHTFWHLLLDVTKHVSFGSAQKLASSVLSSWHLLGTRMLVKIVCTSCFCLSCAPCVVAVGTGKWYWILYFDTWGRVGPINLTRNYVYGTLSVY